MRKFIALAAISLMISAATYFSSCKGKEDKKTTTNTTEDSL